jgi:hypothetical protein|tara:strand:+ start:22652 stop:22909 length:258 start_codon:yes stop_codon:yes gene_type:complete
MYNCISYTFSYQGGVLMTAIAIALGMVALFWMAATNIGADTGSETAEAAPTSGETQRPASESLTDGTPPSASGSTDQSEFKSAKG